MCISQIPTFTIFPWFLIKYINVLSSVTPDILCENLSILIVFQSASYITFDLTIPRGTSFGLYARRNALPTHTHHNFMEVISGLREAGREARAAEVSFLSNLF